MNLSVLKIVLLALQLVIVFAVPNPIFINWSRTRKVEEVRRSSGGRSYNDIARVLNPSPYAFPRRTPFPGQPFWPFG